MRTKSRLCGLARREHVKDFEVGAGKGISVDVGNRSPDPLHVRIPDAIADGMRGKDVKLVAPVGEGVGNASEAAGVSVG